MNRKEILQAIHSGVRPLPELSYADLRGADLRYADLRYADLRNGWLRGADLYGADLRGADLRDAKLQDAYLRSADLSGADLRYANLWYADLRDVELWYARYNVRTTWPEGFTIPESMIFMEKGDEEAFCEACTDPVPCDAVRSTVCGADLKLCDDCMEIHIQWKPCLVCLNDR